MEFLNFLTERFFFDYDPFVILDFIIRVVVATVCGALLGVERTKRFKEAGIRTHCVVAAASAVFMLLSKYAFTDLGIDTDASRIASQVVSGISFLGAGAIFRNGNIVRGLTTAAGIWATAAIGMAVGSGMYFLGIFLTVLILLVQLLMHKFRIGYDTLESVKITLVSVESEDLKKEIKAKLNQEWHAIVDEYSIEREEEGLLRHIYALKLGKNVKEEALYEYFENKEEIISFGIKKL